MGAVMGDANNKICTCDPNAFIHPDCAIHVSCDDNCKALEQPETLEEVRAALEHWRDHDAQGGCSHGR